MNAPLRRGVCPGLSAPLQTGDGLLVRMRPLGPVALAAFSRLCALATKHGNGVIEITARGSIQVRGLRPASVPRFAAAVADLGIMADDGIPVLTNPLAGIASEEIIDLTAVAVDLRRDLAQRLPATKLSPKASVVIDGGGLSLDPLSAELRLCAVRWRGDVVLQISVAGDGASAVPVGCVAVGDASQAVIRTLEVLANRGRNARARDILAAEGLEAFRSGLADILLGACTPRSIASSTEVIGSHRLLDRSCAYGVGLAFGHADACWIEYLIRAAEQAGASGFAAAPGRALIAVGLWPDAVSDFCEQAKLLKFIVHADDPRRRVVACAGAPFCASGHISARSIAPRVAEAAAQFCEGFPVIHLSGCAKGCAHPKKAALTIVGSPAGCELVADGSARDAPFAVVAAEKLPAAVVEFARARRSETHHA